MRLFQRHLPVLACLLIYLALLVIASLRYEGFFSLFVMSGFLIDNAFLGIVAVGMTFVIISGGIDLSVGAVMSMSSIMLATLIMQHGWPTSAAMAVTLGLATLLGTGMGALIHYTGMKPFIVTLAGMFMARGLGFLIHLESLAINDTGHAWLAGLAVPLGDTASLPAPALLWLLTVLVGWYTLSCTPFGRAVYALGGNEEAALLMGLPVGRIKVAVYACSGFCAGLAGIVLTLYSFSGNHGEGVGLELDAIAAVVIGGAPLTGGAGSMLGTFFGVLTIGLILVVITAYEAGFSSGFTRVIIAGLLLSFVLLQRLLTCGFMRKRA